MDREVVATRLRDLAAYLDRTPEPEWRWVRVELEAMAKTLYRHPGDDRPEDHDRPGPGRAPGHSIGCDPQLDTPRP